jgi:hypothetical protein
MVEFEKKDLVGFMLICRPSCRVVGFVPICRTYVEL